MIFDTLALDSARTIDDNGYLHVATSNITKEQVAPYVGDSIPGWQELGLEPRRVYMIYRPAEEIAKAAGTFNGLPLSLDHWEMDAANLPKDKIVGSLGTDAEYRAPYLINSLTVTDADAIEKIKTGEYRDLSAGYLCDVEIKPGIFDGKSYDGIMRNIRGNHVALVREGRAGHDVRVADAAPGGGEKMETWKELFFKLTEALKNGGDEVTEEKKVEVINEEKPAEVVQETTPADTTNTAPAVEEAPAKDEEPVDEIAAELREAMTAAGLDPEDKAAQKAFLAGMAYSKPAEDEAADGAEAEAPATAQDAAPVFDKAMASALYAAAEEVAPHIGKIADPFAFDSAAAIYKKALDAKHVNTDGVDPSAYGAMVRMIKIEPEIPAPVADDPMNEMLRGIRSR